MVAGYVGVRTAVVGRLERFGALFRRALVSAYRDNCLGIAKGAAYSALLASFPVLTTVTAILVQANAYSVSLTLTRLIFQVVPPGTEQMMVQVLTSRGRQPVSLLVLASLLSVWAASGIMLSLMEGFRAAYRIPTGRSLVRGRLIAALLVVSAGLPILIASALLVFGERIEGWILSSIGVWSHGQEVQGWISWVAEILRTLVAVGAIVGGTSLLYCIGPNPPRKLHSVLPGAILATILWWIATSAFSWYVRSIGSYNVLYGSVGAVIALLVWMYLLSVIALIGCEFNAERDRIV
jgi:membrane protein